MKKWIGKVISYEFQEKWIAILSSLLLVVMLIPVIRLAFYTIPWFDDYDYALHVKGFIEAYGIWPGAVKGAAYVVRTWWWCWQGTFSSIFMMSLMPEVFGEGYYYLGIIVIVLFFTISSVLLVKIVMEKVLKASKAIGISAAVLITLTMLELIYTAQQGVYWYNAAVHYTFMHGCMFLFLAINILVLYETKWTRTIILAVASTFLALVCSGSNFVTALQGLLFFGVLMALGVLYKRKTVFCLMPAVCVYGYGLFLNLTAPGNDLRGMYFQGKGALQSILLSFKSGVVHFWEFTGIITILILLIYGLLIWNTVERLEFSFPMPGLISLFSFAFYCTGYTSSYYGMGSDGLARTWVVVKFTLQLLLFINVSYWMGWIQTKCKKRGMTIVKVKQWVWAYALFGCLAALWLCTNPNQAGSCLSYGAYYYVHTGEAYNLQQEYLQRVDTIESSESDMVEVAPYAWKPWFLYKGELSSDPSADKNIGMAEWYGKSGIYIKE